MRSSFLKLPKKVHIKQLSLSVILKTLCVLRQQIVTDICTHAYVWSPSGKAFGKLLEVIQIVQATVRTPADNVERESRGSKKNR